VAVHTIDIREPKHVFWWRRGTPCLPLNTFVALWIVPIYAASHTSAMIQTINPFGKPQKRVLTRLMTDLRF